MQDAQAQAVVAGRISGEPLEPGQRYLAMP